jgi:RNA polymerase sigma-70 factor (ECF subfamily)
MTLTRTQPLVVEPTDDELATSARTGDHDAFARLYRRHAVHVYARVTRLVGPVPERDDLVQQVFLRLHQALPEYRGLCGLPSFLYRITVTTALDHLRSNKRRRAEAFSEQELDALVGAEINEGGRAQARDDLRALFRALERLAPKKRLAFLLVAVEGMSLTEAAAMVGASADTVKQRVLAARRTLHGVLDREKGAP